MVTEYVRHPSGEQSDVRYDWCELQIWGNEVDAVATPRRRLNRTQKPSLQSRPHIFSCQERTVAAMSEDVMDRDESSSLAATVQEVIQSVAASREGQAPDDIFVALKAELAKRALTPSIPNEALRAYADAIAEGREVSVDPKDLVGQT